MIDQTNFSSSSQRDAVPATTDVAIVPMTADMISQVVKLHLDAFAGYMNTRIGNAYVKKFLNWFRQEERAIALIAIDNDNTVIGYVIGAPLGYNKPMDRELLWVAASGIVIRPWLFFTTQFRNRIAARLRLLLSLALPHHTEPELPEPTMSLVGIGVLSSARGRKIGLRLIRAFEKRARQFQMRSLRLSVYPNNIAARRLYEACGWRPFTELLQEQEAMYYFRLLQQDDAQK